MANRPKLSLHDLRRILRSFGVSEDTSAGKGSHTKFFKQFPEGCFSYPVPKDREVKDCYVRGSRKKFRLTPEHGVSDDVFYGR